jgi:hypothetical protein
MHHHVHMHLAGHSAASRPGLARDVPPITLHVPQVPQYTRNASFMMRMQDTRLDAYDESESKNLPGYSALCQVSHVI